MNTNSPYLKLNANRILALNLGIIFILVGLSILGQYLRFFQSYADIRPWMEVGLDLTASPRNLCSSAKAARGGFRTATTSSSWPTQAFPEPCPISVKDSGPVGIGRV